MHPLITAAMQTMAMMERAWVPGTQAWYEPEEGQYALLINNPWGRRRLAAILVAATLVADEGLQGGAYISLTLLRKAFVLGGNYSPEYTPILRLEVSPDGLTYLVSIRGGEEVPEEEGHRPLRYEELLLLRELLDDIQYNLGGEDPLPPEVREEVEALSASTEEQLDEEVAGDVAGNLHEWFTHFEWRVLSNSTPSLVLPES